MKLQDLFPGSFRATHFQGGPQTFTIKAITPILFEEDDESKQKGKMTFNEVSSYWVFGKEAAGELAEELGGEDDTDRWIGKTIELRLDQTRYKGEMVACIRGHFAEARSRALAQLNPAQMRPEDLEQLEKMLAEAKKAAGAKPELVKVPA